ncbi:MAG: T9SS type A sorting domain-containing protein [Salinivirgaceae bacterium]|nr:T9SS type A sorting domain-containing protein [Salinivirgaceae bacterium]
MKKIFITISFLLTTIALTAQPNEWSVSGADYEYSMTVSAIVEYEGVNQGSENDFLGAFVGNECRGVAQASYIEANDNYLFFMVIFANEYSGEIIEFKFFNDDNQNILEGFHTLSFADGQNLGTASIPYIVSETEWIAPITHISTNSISLYHNDNNSHLSETFHISNLGGGYLSYQTTLKHGNWCIIETAPQELSANESAPITLQADTENLSPGEYFDTLTIHSERLIHIPVSLTISSVGINAAEQINWSIFPNPAHSNVQIQANSAINILTIIDACGKSLVNLQPGVNIYSIDISNLPQGVYITKIQTKNGIATKKLLIEKSKEEMPTEYVGIFFE